MGRHFYSTVILLFGDFVCVNIYLYLKSHKIQFIILLLLIFLIIFLRATETLLLPELRKEDGTAIFAFFYNNRDPNTIFRFKGGYIPLLANIIGYTSIFFPTRLIPYIITWTPLTFTLIAYTIFFSHKFRIYISSDLLRFGICLGIALNPIGQFHLISHTDYSIWNTLLILIFMSIIRFPKQYRFIYFIFYNMLIWSHPLTIVILPWLLFFLYADKDKTNKLYYLLSLLNLLFHQTYGVQPLNISFSISKLFFNVWHSIHYIVNLVVFRSSFGIHSYRFIQNNYPYIPFIYFLILVYAFFDTLKKRQIKSKLLTFFVYYSFSITYLNTLYRGTNYISKGWIPTRYQYIQCVLFTVVLIVLITNYIPVLFFKFSNHANRMRKLSLLVILLYFLFLNFGNTSGYHSHKENGLRVKHFMEKLEKLEKEKGSRKGIKLRLEKINDWPIEIDTTS